MIMRIAAAVVAALVRRGDFVALGGRLREQAAISRDTFADRPVCSTNLRRAAGEVHHLAHQIGVHLGDELVEVQIEIVEPRAQLRGVVVTQVRRVEVIEVRCGA